MIVDLVGKRDSGAKKGEGPIFGGLPSASKRWKNHSIAKITYSCGSEVKREGVGEFVLRAKAGRVIEIIAGDITKIGCELTGDLGK